MPGAAHWRGVQLVDVRCKTAYLPHMLRNPMLRATLARYGLADNPLLDLLYIAANVSGALGRSRPCRHKLPGSTLRALRSCSCLAAASAARPRPAISTRSSTRLNGGSMCFTSPPPHIHQCADPRPPIPVPAQDVSKPAEAGFTCHLCVCSRAVRAMLAESNVKTINSIQLYSHRHSVRSLLSTPPHT
jgi:hypothetical protein